MDIRINFVGYAEDRPGAQWKATFDRTWTSYRAWFLRSGGALGPSFVECRRALREHMPAFVPIWEELIDLSGGSDLEARFLSMWCPPAYITGCAQAIWIDPAGREGPALFRNYDFAPALLEGCWTATRWLGQRVLSVSDCLCGALDGMNEAGLAASLSFGGREIYGRGFGVPLIMRYILEVAETTADAVKALSTLPSSMSYSIALLDRSGDWCTVFITPDRPAEATRRRTTTNLQHRIEWAAHARATHAAERLERLDQAVARAKHMQDITTALLRPPLFQTSYKHGYGTLYTAVYQPSTGTAQLHWQNESWSQEIGHFTAGERCITYPILG